MWKVTAVVAAAHCYYHWIDLTNKQLWRNIVTDSSLALPDVIMAEVVVAADSSWFCGHFPDNPILPGVAQLEMVLAAIARIVGKNLYVARLSRVKFKSLVYPGEGLRIEARARAEVGACTFSIHAGDREVCHGSMILLEKNSENT